MTQELKDKLLKYLCAALSYGVTTEQLRWLEANFAERSNAECAAHCGCSERTVIRKARELGLAKSAEFMRRSQRNASEHARIMNQGDAGNTYPRAREYDNDY